MTGRLIVGADGRLRGPASIGWNTPFPTHNGGYGSGAMRGVVMHTEVGYDHNVQVEFNTPAAQASATFSIRDDGHITQYGPVGKGWYAWAQAAGNLAWYSIEHEDHGDQHNPLTDAQLTASAQVVECLSNYAGFPLDVTDSVNGRGFGTHVMGGASWGGHTCPGPGPRAMQRYEIVKRAAAIRKGAFAVTEQDWTADGKTSLAQAAALHKTEPSSVLRRTAIHDGAFPADVAAWINAVFGGKISPEAPVPKGAVLRVPA